MECIICCECTELLSLQCKCNICSRCLIQSIDTKYIEVVDQIKCPGNCNSKHIIDSLIQDPLLSGLHDILLHKYMRTNENLRICPKSDCNYGGMLIEKCYEYQCECGYLWKEKKNNLSWKSMITALFTTRDCPKCNRGIYKNGGCNHMTCKCHYEFCWICTQQFQNHQKIICLQNVGIKYFLLFFMLLTLIHELGQINIFITTVSILVKLLLFNASLMFFYLGMNELYQMSKLRFECRKYYQYGNESYKRMGQQKLLMFIVMMVQFAIMCFFFNLFYVGEFIAQYLTLLINETGFAVIIGTSVKLNSLRK